MRSWSFVVFFAVIILLDALFHWYLWARLVRDPGWPARVRLVLTILTITLAVGLPAGMIASRTLPRSSAELIATGTFTWMGAMFILLMIVAGGDLIRALVLGVAAAYAKLSGSGDPIDPARRELIARGFAAASGVAALGATGVAVRSGLADVTIPEVPVKLERLPPQLSGLTVVQMSDIHVGPLIGQRFVRTIVEKSNALKPDVVVLTGDLVDGSVRELRAHTELLGKLRARWGVYFVTGNHEYYSGVESWMKELQRLGIRVLRNEHVRIGDAASIDLAGVDDAQAHRFGNGHGEDVERAVQGRDPERELILLAHQPKAIEAAARAGAGLQLSGHTHGGQIWPFRHAVGLVQPYVDGLHRHGDRTQIYVSRGTGFWGPPMRLAAPAEITKIILT